jgi:succinate dehydrogenase flavin-adding protein (antitoxin of CptAB toxin-antitoxin module)
MNPETDSRARAVAPTEMSRLRWQCRRGMRELDVVIESLLELQDPLLLAYVTGKESPDNKVVADVVAQLAVTPS